MKYIIKKISKVDEVFNFEDIATTESETWAKNIVSALTINMKNSINGEFGIVPVEYECDEEEDHECDEKEWYEDLVNTSYFETLEKDGLDGDITVTIEGKAYPLFIDYFNNNVEKNVRTYFAHYYKGNSSGRPSDGYGCVYYTFTNEDMSNINKI